MVMISRNAASFHHEEEENESLLFLETALHWQTTMK
jgi:hypothetical protein